MAISAMNRTTANAVFVCRVATIFQRFLEEPEHREGFHEMVQMRAWRWWSEAQQFGVVLQ